MPATRADPHARPLFVAARHCAGPPRHLISLTQREIDKSERDPCKRAVYHALLDLFRTC
ncbi:hypothetical protein [Amycolatopsis sulphurea]|uniref:hypothetical protein n=1 Tax=Amycolatopsis sulphurea TaxID=76022 RepID=UPI00147350DD|nr:hypothetical protein [Amycolatopsis sulphurea]